MKLIEAIQHTKLAQKITGLFQKRRMLPAAKMIEEDTEKVEEKITPEMKFKEELTKQAEIWNPELVGKKEAIMHILQEKGLASEILKNPKAQEVIMNAVENMGIDKINKENMEAVAYRLANHVTTNGEFTYMQENTEKDREERITQVLTLENDGQLSYSERTNSQRKVSTKEGLLNLVIDVLDKSTYNEQGIAMKREKESTGREETIKYDGSRETNYLKPENWKMTRNEDMVTAYVYTSEYNESEGYGSDILLNTEHPNELFSDADISLEGIREKRDTLGWEGNYIPNKPTTEEKEQIEASKKILLDSACKKSEAFRKTVEKQNEMEESR